ncbi:PKD [Pedobacter sp. BAL39]|uniref:PKD domain-containing protein n=1 Tax=Pedobacter sp. BAL39 TaxID=391596 RepID=UPI000155A1DE|nr:PKD domain-containing protein [Pedobacter sp. BAL39]EDM37446.1 PKD [Pedobacter sp. BAL39]
MIKRLLLLTVLAFSLQLSAAFSQINFGSVEPGPYAPGSTITALFNTGSLCIERANTFELFLSDATGNFAAETRIGTYNSFYSTFVNGRIPVATPPGTGYRVRIRSTSLGTYSAPSSAFEIRAGVPATAALGSAPGQQLSQAPLTFGNCDTDPNVTSTTFRFTNESSTGNVSVRIINEMTPTAPEGAMTFASISEAKTFAASLAHYTMVVKATMPDGSIATHSYFLVNNLAVTAFTTTSGNTVCYPTGTFEYSVTVYDATGIGRNFPGNTYRIDWGDGRSDEYTICDIVNDANRVRHSYTESSCGRSYTSGSQTFYNAFGVNVNVQSPFCGAIGSPLSTPARVVTRPENRFSFPPIACLGDEVTFVNQSLPGQRANTNSIGCADNELFFNWYVDGVLVAENLTLTENFVHTFTTKGPHEIRLTSTGSGACPADDLIREICVQDPPQPAFILSGNTLCLSSATINANSSTSVIDNTCPNTPTYIWNVTPNTGVNIGNASSPSPSFTFAQTGVYNITLTIQTGTCEVTTAPQEVVVNAPPQATLSPDIDLCARGDYTFGPNGSVTNTVITGTSKPVADTYTWTVTGAGGYSFVGPSSANSQYPTINFEDFGTYVVTITHKNNCGTVVSTQELTFSPAPVPSITANPAAICYNDNINLTGAISNGTANTTFEWRGAGTFTPANTLTTVYTPTAAERTSGIANITLFVNTGITGSCAQVQTSAAITIYPRNIGTNPPASRMQSICTGTRLTFQPTSSVTPSTYRWTAVNADGNASGFNATGNGIIDQTITNNNPTQNAVVVYTIIPVANGCDGEPFTFTVTVTPNPILTATAASPIICSNSATGITLSSNLQNTTYRWTSSVIGTVTGNSSPTGTSSGTTIPDILINTGTAQGSVTYVITPVSENGCPGAARTVTIQVDPPVTIADAGQSGNICDDNSYTLNGNTAIVGTGRWTQVAPFPNVVTFADDTFERTTVTGLTPGQTYTFRWTITGTGACPETSSTVTITVNEPTIAGTLDGAATVCQGINSGQLNLSGSRGAIIRWESSIDGGVTWTEIQNTTTSYNYTNLTQTTQYRVIVQNGNCDQKISNTILVTVTPAGTVADAGPSQVLCAPTALAPVSATLTGNAPAATETGLWTVTPANPSLVIENPAGPTTRVNGLMPGQSYSFTWTISGTSACGPNSSNVTVQILLPIENNTITSSSAIVCSGRLIDIIGSTVTGGTGNYSYTWERSVDNGTSWTPIPNETNKDLLNYQVVETTIFRRNVSSASCSLFSNEYTVTAQPPVANNTITADQTICSGLSPAELIGSLPTGGDGLFRYQWQSSTDGNSWVNISGALSQNYQPPILTAPSHYRRIVTTAACDGVLQNVSNAVIITVNPNAEAEFTYAFQTGCAPFALDITATPYADRNATYTWYANNNVIGTGIDFPGYTITESNTTATIRLVVTSSLGCTSDEQSTVFSTNQAVPASFSQSTSSGCGPLAVNFVNTSVLTGGATFVWDFGNGQTSTQANPPTVTYLAEPTGKDTTYVVTLTATTSCGTDVRTSTVLVKAQPIAVFSPSRTDGCSPMTVSFTNTSPGSTNTYYYDFGDGSPVLETTDKGPVQHVYTTTTVQLFRARLTVVNECGTDFREYNIRVAPQNITPELVVDATQKEGCAPLLVNFDNNSTGATRFTFDFGDGGTLNTVAPGRVQHTYTRPGTYTVTMTAYNSCSEIATTETITVLPQPVAAFEADVTLGCPGLPVQFRNTTQDGFSYFWDFGDGTTSDEFEPRHIYSGDQEYYTVTLTATNTLGCSISVIRNQYIHVVQAPVARFNVDPSVVIDIPNYTFRFIDESTGSPTNWAWDFGDGTNSSLQSPSHTYPDTGTYRVTLRVMNQQGCFTTTFKDVTIKGVPGYLFVPNSFIPGSPMPELREFRAKGSGMETYKLSIFNKWGELLWETTKLEEGRPAEGWDGTFKGSPMPQGVYFWKMEVKMINGTEWKGMTYDSSPPRRTGPIHLIR